MRLLAAGSACGDDAQPAAAPTDAPETIELTVAAAAEPRPALKYRLTPTPSERTPGNAATVLLPGDPATNDAASEHWQEYDEHQEAWLAKDRRDVSQGGSAEVAAVATEHVLSQLKTATYREYCDWDLRVQDLRGMDTIIVSARRNFRSPGNSPALHSAPGPLRDHGWPPGRRL